MAGSAFFVKRDACETGLKWESGLTDEVMGGKVLQLESERLLELGEARGKIIGKAEGEITFLR